MRNENLISEIASGKEVFFENTFEEFVFRSIPEGGYEAKRKGGKPYEVNIGLKPLTEAFIEGKIISKEEYENY
jgi:hypothetical protein